MDNMEVIALNKVSTKRAGKLVHLPICLNADICIIHKSEYAALSCPFTICLIPKFSKTAPPASRGRLVGLLYLREQVDKYNSNYS